MTPIGFEPMYTPWKSVVLTTRRRGKKKYLLLLTEEGIEPSSLGHEPNDLTIDLLRYNTINRWG